jgi:hypothetical protein
MPFAEMEPGLMGSTEAPKVLRPEFDEEIAEVIKDKDCSQEVKNFISSSSPEKLGRLENLLNDIGEPPKSLAFAEEGEELVKTLEVIISGNLKDKALEKKLKSLLN